MLDASIVTSTFDRVRSASSIASAPLNLPKWPRTFETTMWRTLKLMPEWAGSMFQRFLFVVSLVVMGWLLSRPHSYDRPDSGTRPLDLEYLFYWWNNLQERHGSQRDAR